MPNRKPSWYDMTADAPQESEREAVEAQTQLLAFDRQNHMGASDIVARTLKKAIQEEAEAMLSEKKVVNGAVNIAGNTEKMKASSASATSLPILLCMLVQWHVSQGWSVS